MPVLKRNNTSKNCPYKGWIERKNNKSRRERERERESLLPNQTPTLAQPRTQKEIPAAVITSTQSCKIEQKKSSIKGKSNTSLAFRTKCLKHKIHLLYGSQMTKLTILYSEKL